MVFLYIKNVTPLAHEKMIMLITATSTLLNQVRKREQKAKAIDTEKRCLPCDIGTSISLLNQGGFKGGENGELVR